jgi:hypothetical protein
MNDIDFKKAIFELENYVLLIKQHEITYQRETN